MIVSFNDSETEKIWNGVRVKKLPKEIQETGRRKLRMLNNSFSLVNRQGHLVFSGQKKYTKNITATWDLTQNTRINLTTMGLKLLEQTN